MNHYQRNSKLAAIKRSRVALERSERYRWFLTPLAEAGLSLADITRTMQAYPISTPTGRGGWSKAMVKRALVRLDLYERIAA